MKYNKKNKAFTLIELSVVIVVIAIIIGAIVKGSTIIGRADDAKIAWDSQGADITTPEIIKSPQNKLWLDASNINGQYNAGLYKGDSIQTWQDLSKSKFSITQSTASNRPIFIEKAYGKKPALRFDIGEFDHFSPINLGIYVNTFFFVYHPKNNVTSQNIHGGISFASGNKAFWLGVTTGALENELIFFNSNYPADVWVSSNYTISNKHPHLFAVRYDNNKMNIYFNGQLKNNAIRSSSAVPYIADYFIFGRTNTDHHPETYLNGDVFEFILFDSKIPIYDFIQIQHHLARKWGLLRYVDSDNDGIVDSLDPKPTTPN